MERLRPRYLILLAVPLFFVWMLRVVSLREVWAALNGLSRIEILFLIAVNGLVLLTLSGRWWLLLKSLGYRIPYLTLAGYRLAAFGVSYFTPGPQFGGEPLQVYLPERFHKVPRTTATAAVTLDKVLELIANFGFLVVGSALILRWEGLAHVVGDTVRTQAIIYALMLLAVPAAFLIAIWAGRHPLSALLTTVEKQVPWDRFSRWSQALSVLQRARQTLRASEEQATLLCRQHPRTLFLALLVSIISWGVMVGEYWLALRFLGARLTPAETISALTAARIAFLLPLPGGLGALEASQVLAIGALGSNPAIGISISLLIRARDVALGALGLWWGGMRSSALASHEDAFVEVR